VTEQQQLPPGATPIDLEELLAAMGELYLQVRTLRKAIQQQQRQASPNGVPQDAIRLEP
jgi:hypothetical protein